MTFEYYLPIYYPRDEYKIRILSPIKPRANKQKFCLTLRKPPSICPKGEKVLRYMDRDPCKLESGKKAITSSVIIKNILRTIEHC